jgi:hypothetical protein
MAKTKYVKRKRADGTVVHKFYRDGQLHREGGPALIEIHPDGAVIESYYKNGRLHRERRPASIHKDRKRDIVVAGYWTNGRETSDVAL